MLVLSEGFSWVITTDLPNTENFRKAIALSDEVL